MYPRPGRYVPPARPQGLANTLNRPRPWGQMAQLAHGDGAAPDEGMDPGIAAAMAKRQRFQETYPNFEGALPAPGGPVDLGITQAHPSPMPSAGFPINSGGYQPIQHMGNKLQQLITQLGQQKPHQLPGSIKRQQAVQAGLARLHQNMQQIGHKRTFYGRR